MNLSHLQAAFWCVCAPDVYRDPRKTGDNQFILVPSGSLTLGKIKMAGHLHGFFSSLPTQKHLPVCLL